MIDLFFIFIREHTHTQIGKRKMVMNKDIRYGMGDITFDMNIGWFDHLIYEIGSWYEKDDVDLSDVMELYKHAEELITRVMNDPLRGSIDYTSEDGHIKIYYEIFMKDDLFVELLPKYYTRDN